MSSDLYMLDKEIEDLKAELNQLNEMKYVFAECVYRLNLIITKEKSIIQSLENFEDFDVSEDDILCTFEGEEDMEPMPAL